MSQDLVHNISYYNIKSDFQDLIFPMPAVIDQKK